MSEKKNDAFILAIVAGISAGFFFGKISAVFFFWAIAVLFIEAFFD